MLTFGRSPRQDDGRWRVGLRHPRHPDAGLAGWLSVERGSVVTSGVYQRTLERDGRTFHHILDPSTGFPIDTDVTSLTVVSERSVDGEIWTSRLFGKPASNVLDTVANQAGLDAVIVTDDLRVFATEGLGERLHLGES